MELYDAGNFIGQPPQPMKRIYYAMNGTFNTATQSWDHDNCTPNAPVGRAMFAWRKVARYAAGLEKGEHDAPSRSWHVPEAYLGRPYDMVAIDMEGPEFTNPVDLTVDAHARRSVVELYANRLRAFKDELRYYGRTIPVGLYTPIGAISGEKGLHPADPRYTGYMEQAERDFKPWSELADFICPDLSVHSGIFEEWWHGHESGVSGASPTINALRQAYPGKPIIADVQVCYAHYTERSKTPEKKWQLLEPDYWQRVIGQLAGDARIAGIVIWGAAPETELPAGTDRSAHGKLENGTRRVPWSYVERHYLLARRIVGASKPKPRAPLG